MSSDQGPFRGFKDLSSFEQPPQQQQQQQPSQPAAQQPARNWRYANRSTQTTAPYAQFNGYQTDYQSNRYVPTGHRSRNDEMDMYLSQKEEERQRQLSAFEQKWQSQQQGGSVSHDHFIREGIWARSPDTATITFPWPIHAQSWQNEDDFLNNLEVVEAFLQSKKIYYKDNIRCLVEGCGAELQNAEFVDETNKISWPVSFIHYLGDHNNPPSKIFYDYVRRAATAIRSVQPQ